eukprot:Partr_v1_DN26270_c0_g1_i2_m48231 putative X-ray repair complementing defective repair in Chinese hamster cells 6
MASWSLDLGASTSGGGSYNPRGDEGGDREDFDFDMQGLYVKDHLLFLLDCSVDMWDVDAKFPMSQVLGIIVEIYKAKAINSTSDKLALMLYGTEKSSNPSGQPHIFLVHDLDVPNVDIITRLMALASRGRDMFEEEFGGPCSHLDLKMSDVYWECQKVFTRKSTLGLKRVIHFTCHDNPHSIGNPATSIIEGKRRTATSNRIKDMFASGIHMDLFGLDLKRLPFDFDAFYRDVLPEGEHEGGDEISFNAFKDSVSMIAALRKRQFGKRSLAKVKWRLAPGVDIAVELYSMILEAKRPSYQMADAQSLKAVQSTTTWTEAATGRQIDKDKISPSKAASSKRFQSRPEVDERQTETLTYLFEYGGSSVEFSQKEIAEIKDPIWSNTSEEIPGLELLCFKAKDSLQLFHNVRSPYFVYPREAEINGSMTLFSTLLLRCASKSVLPICRFKPRKNSQDRIVALIPQLEVLDENEQQHTPAGFHVIPLPFADEIRALPSLSQNDKKVEPPEEAVALMKQIIGKLELSEYSPSRYRNPNLQAYYNVLEALALDLEEIPSWEDTTLPPVDRFNKLNSLFEQLSKSIHGEDDEEEVKAPAKRGRTKKEPSAPAAKRARIKKEPLPKQPRVSRKTVTQKNESDEEDIVTSDEEEEAEVLPRSRKPRQVKAKAKKVVVASEDESE